MKFKLLIILFVSIVGFAQEYVEPIDSASIYVEPEEMSLDEKDGLIYASDILDTLSHVPKPALQRAFPDAFKDKYNTDDFEYSLTKPKESLWDRISRYLNNLLSHLFDFDDVSQINHITEWVMQGLAVLIIGLVLYWLLKYLMGKQGSFFFSKSKKEINPNIQTIKENIHEIDFDKIISTHEIEKNYRYAVRYQFLHLLKIFTDNSLIQWDPDKTNADYIKELTDKPQQVSFTQLVQVFNYVWYGEFAIDKEDYAKVKEAFKQLKQRTNE